MGHTRQLARVIEIAKNFELAPSAWENVILSEFVTHLADLHPKSRVFVLVLLLLLVLNEMVLVLLLDSYEASRTSTSTACG